MSLQRRREKLIILFVWKIKNNIVPNDIHLQFSESTRRSGVKAILKTLPKIKGKVLTLYEHSFVVRAAKLWNKLPCKISSLDNFNVFQSKLDVYLRKYPDKPPVAGYYHANTNSILDYASVNA